MIKENKFPEFIPTPEDKQNMERLVLSAKEILARAEEKLRNRNNVDAIHDYDDYETIFEEDSESHIVDFEKLAREIEKMQEQTLDEKNDLYTNVTKGSLQEVFYRTVMEEMPDLGLSLSDDARDINGKLVSDSIAIHATPYKTDKEFLLLNLETDPAIRVLCYTSHPYDLESGEALEKQGILPTGITRRLLARFYQDYINRSSDPSFWQKKLSELGNIIPVSDEEAQEIMRPIIQEKRNERLGI